MDSERQREIAKELDSRVQDARPRAARLIEIETALQYYGKLLVNARDARIAELEAQVKK